MAADGDNTWLQQMLQAIQDNVSETNRNVTETNRNVTETKEAIAALKEEVKAIGAEQARLDDVLNQHEAEFRLIRADLTEIKANNRTAAELQQKFAGLEQKHETQQAEIQALREWKISRESAWSGPTVIIAAVTSIIPIVAALYGAVQFLRNTF